MEPTRTQRLKLWAKAHTDEIVAGSFVAVSTVATVALVVIFHKASKDLAEVTLAGTLPHDVRIEAINGVERAVNVLADKDGAELWMFVVPPAE